MQNPKNPSNNDDGISIHHHILAGIKPEHALEELREARERAKKQGGYTDEELDRWYGVHSRRG